MNKKAIIFTVAILILLVGASVIYFTMDRSSEAETENSSSMSAAEPESSNSPLETSSEAPTESEPKESASETTSSEVNSPEADALIRTFAEIGEPYTLHSRYYNQGEAKTEDTMPVFVVIPYSWSYLAEEKNGYDRIMASQLGKASYFLGKYVSTFLSGALTVLLPMLFSFLLASCLVPAYRPDINFALYYQVSATKLLGNLYYAHPLCTAFLNMLMIGIFAGAWATIPLALSFFEKNKFVVLFAPYLVLLYIIASLQKASVYRSFTETSVLNYIWMTSSSSNQSIVVYTIMTVSLILLPLAIVLERGKNADVY